MHEMSIAMNIFEIAKQEMQKNGKNKLLSVSVVCGALSNIVPDALRMGFEAVVQETEHAEANIKIKEIPLCLACGQCKKHYNPENSYAAVFTPCPFCGEEIGHQVISGKELYIETIEVE